MMIGYNITENMKIQWICFPYHYSNQNVLSCIILLVQHLYLYDVGGVAEDRFQMA